MHDADKADLLYGVPAIATYLGLTEAQVYHLTKKLPTFKIGGKVCARKARLDGWIAEQEEAERLRWEDDGGKPGKGEDDDR